MAVVVVVVLVVVVLVVVVLVVAVVVARGAIFFRQPHQVRTVVPLFLTLLFFLG